MTASVIVALAEPRMAGASSRLRQVRAFGPLLAAPFVFAACGDDSVPAETAKRIRSESSQGCGKTDVPKGLLSRQSITVKGEARTYDLVVPDAYDPNAPCRWSSSFTVVWKWRRDSQGLRSREPGTR